MSKTYERLAKTNFRNEADAEEKIIRPVLRALGLPYDVQTGLHGQSVDYAVYLGDEFQKDYRNTILLIEAEHYGKLKNHYFIKKQDNSDPIAQIRNYLRKANEKLGNEDSGKTIDFGLLTDGAKWRLYSRRFTHDDKQFEQNFLEFDFSQIATLPSEAQYDYLKLFAFLLSSQGVTTHLSKTAQESQNHEEAVTTELRKQVYPALELIATGLWRRIMVEEEAVVRMALTSQYGFSDEDLEDVERRSDLLKIVYDESLVFLLRLLFILSIEDRRVTDISAIKQPGGILDVIRAQNQPIGQLQAIHSDVHRNFDVDIAKVSNEINKRYNGGIFSDAKHPLLSRFPLVAKQTPEVIAEALRAFRNIS